MLPKDYIAYKMSNTFATDVSDASGTLCFDVKNKTWSLPMLKILGINQSQLPKIYESYEVIGNVSQEFAKLTGMSIDTKVIIGGGDQAVGAVGTGTVDDNMLSISLGTSGVLFLSCNQFKKINNGVMHSFAHANGKYHIMGVMLSAAGSFD
jgi:xylulokinase